MTVNGQAIRRGFNRRNLLLPSGVTMDVEYSRTIGLFEEPYITPRPILSSPSEDASVVGTPGFAWQALTGATSYQMTYADDAELVTNAYLSTPSTSRSHTPPAMARGLYYWSVRAMNAASVWGLWSLPRSLRIQPPNPTVPTLVLLADAAVTNVTTPTFTWTGAANETFDIQLATDSGFTANVLLYENITTPYVLALALTPENVVWYWRMRATNLAVPPVVSAWSTARSFTLDTIAPDAPALSSPLDNATVAGSPSFSWAASTGATYYQFQMANDTSFTSNVYTGPQQSTRSISPTTSVGVWYWHVRARDAAGNWCEYSAYRKITRTS